jgi:tetrahydromethanopterin S-methyltransferase subunit G
MIASIMEAQIARLENAYEQVDRRLAMLEHRIESGFSNVDARFAQIESRFLQVDERFTHVDARLDRLDAKVDGHFAWMVGLLLTAILLPILRHYLPF